MDEQSSTFTVKAAIYKHFDSRGGTMALILTEPVTADSIIQANKCYNALFGIDEAGDEITHTAYGMEARECDKQVHALIYGDNRTPADEDFDYVAEIHGIPEDYIGQQVDLDGGQGDDTVMVGGEEPINPAYQAYQDETARLAGEKTDHKERWKVYTDRDDACPPNYTNDQLVDLTIANPVQLEYVTVPEGWDEHIRIAQKYLEDGAHGQGIWVQGFSSDWTDEQKAIQKRYHETWEELEKQREKLRGTFAKVIKNPTEARWNDDAYGFILIWPEVEVVQAESIDPASTHKPVSDADVDAAAEWSIDAAMAERAGRDDRQG